MRQPSHRLILCANCGEMVDPALCTIDANIEFQGAIPLLVIYNRCQCCGYEWTDAHEPQLLSSEEDHQQP